MNENGSLIRLRGAVQHYDWGGYDFIPDLLGIAEPEQKPYAELWLGAHSRGPAQATINRKSISLDKWIARAPADTLGKPVAARFNDRLPFLFKVLDVRRMLSIQLHPTKEAAERGFQREEAAGIPRTAPHRNYKDDNHKPELMVALSDFWLLHGFKSPDDIRETLISTPGLSSLVQRFSYADVPSLYEYIMQCPQREIDRLLTPLAYQLNDPEITANLTRDEPDYWAAQAFQDYQHDGHYDRGILSIYLFNLLRLKPGEGIFQGAGIPHAYLQGVNVELMANSDNVLRGGLTPKHIDVPELLQHINFNPVTPQILNGEDQAGPQLVYKTPAPDFELSLIELKAGDTFTDPVKESPAVFLIMDGRLESAEAKWQRGDAFFSPAGEPVKLSATTDSRVFRAGVPERVVQGE